MRYIATIRLNKEKRTYLIDAADETQVKKRLLLRLPPHQRDNCQIDEIKLDPKSLAESEPFGMYTED